MMDSAYALISMVLLLWWCWIGLSQGQTDNMKNDSACFGNYNDRVKLFCQFDERIRINETIYGAKPKSQGCNSTATSQFPQPKCCVPGPDDCIFYDSSGSMRCDGWKGPCKLRAGWFETYNHCDHGKYPISTNYMAVYYTCLGPETPPPTTRPATTTTTKTANTMENQEIDNDADNNPDEEEDGEIDTDGHLSSTTEETSEEEDDAPKEAVRTTTLSVLISTSRGLEERHSGDENNLTTRVELRFPYSANGTQPITVYGCDKTSFACIGWPGSNERRLTFMIELSDGRYPSFNSEGKYNEVPSFMKFDFTELFYGDRGPMYIITFTPSRGWEKQYYSLFRRFVCRLDGTPAYVEESNTTLRFAYGNTPPKIETSFHKNGMVLWAHCTSYVAFGDTMTYELYNQRGDRFQWFVNDEGEIKGEFLFPWLEINFVSAEWDKSCGNVIKTTVKLAVPPRIKGLTLVCYSINVNSNFTSFYSKKQLSASVDIGEGGLVKTPEKAKILHEDNESFLKGTTFLVALLVFLACMAIPLLSHKYYSGAKDEGGEQSKKKSADDILSSQLENALTSNPSQYSVYSASYSGDFSGAYSDMEIYDVRS